MTQDTIYWLWTWGAISVVLLVLAWFMICLNSMCASLRRISRTLELMDMPQVNVYTGSKPYEIEKDDADVSRVQRLSKTDRRERD